MDGRHLLPIPASLSRGEERGPGLVLIFFLPTGEAWCWGSLARSWPPLKTHPPPPPLADPSSAVSGLLSVGASAETAFCGEKTGRPVCQGQGWGLQAASRGPRSVSEPLPQQGLRALGAAEPHGPTGGLERSFPARSC